MRLGYLQFDPVFGEVARNLDHVTAQLEQVETDLIVLPELFATIEFRIVVVAACPQDPSVKMPMPCCQ